jgi:hypothetical protein
MICKIEILEYCIPGGFARNGGVSLGSQGVPQAK